MPILSQDTPYPVPREIIYLEPHEGSSPGLASRKIRPECLDGVLAPDGTSGLRAVNVALNLAERRFLPGLDITFWGSDADGAPLKIAADTASLEILRAGFSLLSAGDTSDPLDIAAREADEDVRYWRATYLPHCTVVGWDDLGYGLDDHVGSDPMEDEWSPSLSEIFGPAYALATKSNHERIAAQAGILDDLAFHTRLINCETGFHFTLGE